MWHTCYVPVHIARVRPVDAPPGRQLATRQKQYANNRKVSSMEAATKQRAATAQLWLKERPAQACHTSPTCYPEKHTAEGAISDSADFRNHQIQATSLCLQEKKQDGRLRG